MVFRTPAMQSHSHSKHTQEMYTQNLTSTSRDTQRERARLERLSEITESSDGAYASAFARWANGWRALQWQERQRVAETER